jgi:hypothetical protein
VPRRGNASEPSIFDRARHRVARLRRALRGADRSAAPALPIGEALHPATLLALAVLVANDWVWKPRAGPTAALITGKLSDVAGLALAPVILSAAIGLALHAAARLGARVDPSLSRRRLLGCIAATGLGFVAVKLAPEAAGALARALGSFGRPAWIVADPTDLAALPALAVALWVGRDELARVPLGRPAAILRLGRPAAAALADARWAGADAASLARVAAALDAGDPRRADTCLAELAAR